MFLHVLLTRDNILTQSQHPVPFHHKHSYTCSWYHLDWASPTQPGYKSSVAPPKIHAPVCSHLLFFSAFCGSPSTWPLTSDCNSFQSCATPWTKADLISHSRHCFWAQGTILFLLLLVPLNAPASSAPGFPTGPSPSSFHWEEWPLSTGKVLWELWEHLGCLGRSGIGVEQEFFSGRRAGMEFQAGRQCRGTLIHPVYPGINSSLFRWQSGRALLNWVSEVKTCDTPVSWSSPYLIPSLLPEHKCICHPGPKRSEFKKWGEMGLWFRFSEENHGNRHFNLN